MSRVECEVALSVEVGLSVNERGEFSCRFEFRR